MKRGRKNNVIVASLIVLILIAAFSVIYLGARLTGHAILNSQGLIAYYSFENNLLDSSGNGLNGNGIGVGFAPGRLGSSANFSGSSYINLGNRSILNFNNEITISMFVKKSTYPLAYLISKAQECNSEANYNLRINAYGNPEFSYWDGTGTNNYYVANYTVPLNQWTLITIAYSYKTYAAKFYINGSLVSGTWKYNPAPDNPSAVITPNNLSIGAMLVYANAGACANYSKGQAVNFFRGSIDELKIWNRTLSQSEILAEYNYYAQLMCNNNTLCEQSLGENISSCPSDCHQAPDTTPPSYSNALALPANPAYSPSNSYRFNVTWNDTSGISRATLSFNNVNYTMANSGSIYSYSLSGLGAGTYSYSFWANDTKGNVNKTLSYNYTIIKTSCIVYTYLNSARSNFSVLVGNSTWINGTRTTGESQIILYNNGSLIGTGINISNYTQFKSVGIFNITAICSASQNYTQASETWWLTVTQTDNSAPTFTSLQNITIGFGNSLSSQIIASDASGISCFQE